MPGWRQGPRRPGCPGAGRERNDAPPLARPVRRHAGGRGQAAQVPAIVDEHTRECHALEVERSITAEDVVATLEHLFRVQGEPKFIRSDNGPEFIAHAVKEWLATSGVGTLYIEPGSPWENACVESFNSQLADELPGRELFTSLTEAKAPAELEIRLNPALP